MNYEKKYNEALERMKSWVRGEHPECFTEAKKTAEFIFPELKESGGEKVKRILHSISSKISSHLRDIFTEEEFQCFDSWSYAWLEKYGEQNLIMAKSPQLGEQKPFDYEDANIQQKDFAPKSAIEAAKEEKIDNANKVEPKDYNSIDPHFGKPADKVEPRFKVGYWVVISTSDGEKVVQIDSIEYFKSGEPRYITSEGRWFGNGTKAHLWTIQDAKDGDVLVCKGDIKDSNGIKYERICLFNNLNKAFFTLTKTSNGIEEYDIDVNIDYPDNTIPATKEQKEILFMKMKDAGWEFDFEKKELKKIESQHSQWSISDFRTWQHIVSDVLTKHDGIGQYLDNGFCKKIAQYMQEEWSKKLSFEQKPTAWSEEDEQIVLSIEQAMNCASLLNVLPEKMDKIRTWLKSLKDKYTWKPSSIQMECLHDAIKHYHTNGYPASKLKELYEQMSKIYKL